MKICNSASCESCEFHGLQTFKLMECPVGIVERSHLGTDCMIYILSGSLSVKCDDEEECLCEANRIVLLACNKKYSIHAVVNTRVLIHSFVANYLVCDKMELKDIKNVIDSIRYKFYTIDIKEPMKMLLDSIIYYLEDDINCSYWQKAKGLELFVIFWNYYTLEEIGKFFYPVINKDIGFHSKVMANYTKAKTVMELAKLCGYSLSMFNKLFAKHFQGSSPYQWMLQQNASVIKAKLLDKTIPIKHIVAEFGFIDQSYFNKYCKRFYGATAYQVRKGFE